MRLFLTAFIGTMLLAGCSTIEAVRTNDATIDDNTSAAAAALRALRSGTPAVQAGAFEVIKDRAYIAPKPKVLDDEQTIPRRCQITFAPANSVTLLEFGQTVTKVCGYPVRVTPDALAANQQARESAAESGEPGSSDIPLPPGVSLPPPVMGASIGVPSRPAPHQISIRYTGELAGLLDAVTARLGLSWRYEDGAIAIFYLDTRVFRVFSIPTSTQMDSRVVSGTATTAGVTGGGMGGSSGGAGGSGGVSGMSSSSQSTNVSMVTTPTEDLSRTVASMLTPGVGRVSVSPSTGSVIATDTPEALERIGAYIDQLNAFSTKQVLLNIKVLSVQVNDNDEFGINWNLVYENLTDRYGIGLVNAFASGDDVVSGSVNILEGSRFDGSQLVIDALAHQGRVSVLIQPSVTTLNLEPVPVQVATQTSYLAQSSTTLAADVGSTTSLEPGTVTTGFNMNLLPYILPDSETVLLQYSINISSLNGIRRVESGDSAIEIPEVDSRILSQKVRLRSGETLVLSGFEQASRGNDHSGIGDSRFWLFGGGVKATHEREVLVVLITPIVTA